jgi:hypothetical protein
MWYWAVLALVTLLVAVIWVWEQKTRRGGRPVYRERPDMSIADLHQRYYSGSKVTVADLEKFLGEISEQLGVAVPRLRPTDRFDKELAPTRGWEFDDPLGALTLIARRELTANGLDPDLVANIYTVDDYVRIRSGCSSREGPASTGPPS